MLTETLLWIKIVCIVSFQQVRIKINVSSNLNGKLDQGTVILFLSNLQGGTRSYFQACSVRVITSHSNLLRVITSDYRTSSELLLVTSFKLTLSCPEVLLRGVDMVGLLRID